LFHDLVRVLQGLLTARFLLLIFLRVLLQRPDCKYVLFNVHTYINMLD